MLRRLGSLFGRAKPVSLLPQNNPAPPSVPDKDPNLLKAEGNRLLDLGLFAEAEACYRKAIELNPQDVGILINLGFTLLEQNQSQRAAEVLEGVLEFAPHDPDAHYMLGMAALQRDDRVKALKHFRQALHERPDFDFALRNLSQLLIADGLHEQGNIDEIKQTCTRWISVAPLSPAAHFYLGNALALEGKETEAIASWRRALTLHPQFAEAWAAIGAASTRQCHWVDAAESYRQAYQCKPDEASYLANLAFALHWSGKTDDAIKQLQKALLIQPELIVAHNNFAIFLAKAGRSQEARLHLSKVIDQFPRELTLPLNLACQMNDSGDPIAAIDCLERVLDIEPKHTTALSFLSFLYSHSSEIPPGKYLALARRFGMSATAGATAPHDWSKKTGQVAPEKLRVGFVSGDLRNHPVGHFLESFLHHLDPTRIEIFAYVTYPEEDELSTRIKPSFSGWKSILGITDVCAAEIIGGDGIDVLVDLSGHTAHNRLTLFSWRPAPLQISWLGYWASTGVAEIDYVLADRHCLPPSMSSHFSEKVWFLPDTRMCLAPLDNDLSAGPTPALKNGYPTFGCYQHLAKISSETLAAWSRIFLALPTARLRLQSKNLHESQCRESILTRLENAGIHRQRITLHSASHRQAYLRSYAEVDILLDTFPFSGGTTTCEALWVGVPTLTLPGDRLASRQGAGFLDVCGQNAWIAHDEDDYVRLAVDHANNLDRLTEVRRKLPDQTRSSALFAGPRFASAFCEALHAMWRDKWHPCDPS